MAGVLAPAVLAVTAAAALAACGTATVGRTAATTRRAPAAATKAKTTSTKHATALPSRSGPDKAQLARWAAEGVACSPQSVEVMPSPHPLRLTARLDGYTATLSGIREGGSIPVYQFRSPVLIVAGPNGRSRLPLPVLEPRGWPLTPRDVGPGRTQSALCLVRFAGVARPIVLIGAGGPGYTLASCWSYVVGVPITRTGLSTPVTELAATGGQAGLASQQIVFDGGRPLLLASDGAFGYEGAATFQPPIVVDFVDGRFANTTSAHPGLVRGSAPELWNAWQQEKGSKPPAGVLSLQPLAGWAAVECALGNEPLVDERLSSLRAAGWITPSFVRATEQQIVRSGYCPT